MQQATKDQGILARMGQALMVGLVGALGVVVLIFATVAVAVFGVVIAAVALLGRAGRKRRAAGPELLEARRTPTGWVAEPAPPAA